MSLFSFARCPAPHAPGVCTVRSELAVPTAAALSTMRIRVLVLLLCLYVAIDIVLHISGYHAGGLPPERRSRRGPPIPRGPWNLTASRSNASRPTRSFRPRPPSHGGIPVPAPEGPPQPYRPRPPSHVAIPAPAPEGFPRPYRPRPPSHVAIPAPAPEGPVDRSRGAPAGVTPPGDGPPAPLPSPRATPFKAGAPGGNTTKGGPPRELARREAFKPPPKPAEDPGLTDAVKQRMIEEYRAISIVYTWINLTDPRDKEMRKELGRVGQNDKCQEV